MTMETPVLQAHHTILNLVIHHHVSAIASVSVEFFEKIYW